MLPAQHGDQTVCANLNSKKTLATEVTEKAAQAESCGRYLSVFSVADMFLHNSSRLLNQQQRNSQSAAFSAAQQKLRAALARATKPDIPIAARILAMLTFTTGGVAR